MTTPGEDTQSGAQHHPEDHGRREEIETTGDEDTTDEDYAVSGEHRRTERCPPEVERLHEATSQHQEHDHQPHVGGVEQVLPPPPDEVLGGHREPGHRGVVLPSTPRPVVAGHHFDQTKDQRHTAPGQHPTGRPHQLASLTQRHQHVDQRRHQDGAEDLGERHLKSEGGDPDGVDREDDGGGVEPRVAD